MDYLVKETTYFYDGHGEAEFGGTEISVSSDSSYDSLDESLTYDEYDEVLEDGHDDNFSAEDGYNRESTEIRFKKITDEEAVKYRKLISDYKSLIRMFD